MSKPTIPQVITETGDGRTLRLTIGKLSMWDVATYNVYRREGWDWLEAQGYGRVPSPDEEAAVTDLRLLCNARAQMLAALKKVEAQGPNSDEWIEAALPEEWSGPADFFAGVEGGLYKVWHNLAVEVNAGLFMLALAEPEKNGGAVIVV